jgi:hypothetical protein
MWIAAVEGSRKMKPENPSFMCGLRGGLGGLELRAGDFFPPDFPVPVASMEGGCTCRQIRYVAGANARPTRSSSRSNRQQSQNKT